MNQLITINSIEDLHKEMNIEVPRHPLVSVIHHDNEKFRRNYGDNKYVSDLYYMILKSQEQHIIGYGRNTFDFKSGCIIFLSPGQVITPGNEEDKSRDYGWTLALHPDLIRKHKLGEKIDKYTFFTYAVTQALTLSREEKNILTKLVDNIEHEINQSNDRHSEHLINSTIELLLDYSHRYESRQLNSPAPSILNTDVTSKFYAALKEYYSTGQQLTSGLPAVSYFGDVLHMSPHYLSDLLKKETGKTASDHISQYIIEQAKTRLLNSSTPINQIAFDLGFDYHQHFSKMFRKKTGVSPNEYRRSQ